MVVVQTIVAILFFLTTPFIILGNVLIVSACLRFKTLRTPSNALIASLAISDLGFGLSLPVIVTYQIFTTTNFNEHLPLQWSPSPSSLSSPPAVTTKPIELSGSELLLVDQLEAHNYVATLSPLSSSSSLQESDESTKFPLRSCAILLTFSVSSVVTTAAIALDRFTSVAQPLRYNHFVKTVYVHRFLVFTWLMAISVGGFVRFFVATVTTTASSSSSSSDLSNQDEEEEEEEEMMLMGDTILSWIGILIYLPCLLCTIFSYSYIYHITRGHFRAINLVQVSLNQGDVCHPLNGGGGSGGGGGDSSMHHHRYGLTLTFLIIVFVLSWTPIFVSAGLDHFYHWEILHDGPWRAALVLPTIFSPLLNPMLYGFHSSEIRGAVVRIVDSVCTRLTGRPRKINIFQPNAELTSCASNVRLLAVSPSPTTIHAGCPTPTQESRNYLQIINQTSF